MNPNNTGGNLGIRSNLFLNIVKFSVNDLVCFHFGNFQGVNIGLKNSLGEPIVTVLVVTKLEYFSVSHRCICTAVVAPKDQPNCEIVLHSLCFFNKSSTCDKI